RADGLPALEGEDLLRRVRAVARLLPRRRALAVALLAVLGVVGHGRERDVVERRRTAETLDGVGGRLREVAAAMDLVEHGAEVDRHAGRERRDGPARARGVAREVLGARDAVARDAHREAAPAAAVEPEVVVARVARLARDGHERVRLDGRGAPEEEVRRR